MAGWTERASDGACAGLKLASEKIGRRRRAQRLAIALACASVLPTLPPGVHSPKPPERPKSRTTADSPGLSRTTSDSPGLSRTTADSPGLPSGLTSREASAWCARASPCGASAG
eukprot:scaffold1016_cov258-Pinguiococcus_pyrenoidosus.AAC.2